MTRIAALNAAKPLPRITRLAITVLTSASVISFGVFATALSILVGVVGFDARPVDPAALVQPLAVLVPAILVGTALLHRGLWSRS